MSKIIFYENKTLKLTNVLKYTVTMDLGSPMQDINTQIVKMQNYIKVKGASQVGPLIQYNNIVTKENGEMEFEMALMLQCDSYISIVEEPYSMVEVLRIPNCMYCRYTGPENKLKFAFDKINLEAFEEDVILQGGSYVIFVNENDEKEIITADVFMERAD